MIHTRLAGWLDRESLPTVAALISLALGLFFTFVWAPHPWGWQGIDAYHELARVLARGEPFPTTDVPWGYAYYAAAFYAAFGERLWAPLVGQVIVNSFVPILLYRLVRPLSDQRTAALASLIVGVFSFNTIYASTQSSDAICTTLFLAGLLSFSRGVRESSWPAFALAGVLLGLVPQFRPNMVLLPGVMIAGYLVLPPRRRGKLIQMAVFTTLIVAMQMPWIVRNYQLTGMLLPTSTHGGVQLWYGTLQVGPYLESRAHNPRSHFASPAFDYTSLSTRPIRIDAVYRACFPERTTTELVYWTDRDRQHRRATPHDSWRDTSLLTYELPPEPDPTVLYYYFEQAAPASGESTAGIQTMPAEAAGNPLVYYISGDHLGDLDRHNDMLDVFDLVRMLQHVGWGDPLEPTSGLDLNRDGRIDAGDVEQLVRRQVPDLAAKNAGQTLSTVTTAPEAVTLRLVDGSWLSVPRAFSGNQTDLSTSNGGAIGPALLSRHLTMTSLRSSGDRPQPGVCLPAAEVAVNAPFNWSEPNGMLRYTALAFDNIERDPMAFVRASLYRIMRLFIVRGTSDRFTAQQFRWSGFAYAAGTLLSIAYLAVCLAGVVIAWRRRSPLLLFAVPIVYVPLTICFVLTNMRYTVTVQPLMFVFVAVAIVAVCRLAPAANEQAGN